MNIFLLIADPAMKKEFGRYPIFWQDLEKWPHWSAVYGKYLAATQETKGLYIYNIYIIGLLILVDNDKMYLI